MVFVGFGCLDDEKVCNKYCMGFNCKVGYCDEVKNWLWCVCFECNFYVMVNKFVYK